MNKRQRIARKAIAYAQKSTESYSLNTLLTASSGSVKAIASSRLDQCDQSQGFEGLPAHLPESCHSSNTFAL